MRDDGLFTLGTSHGKQSVMTGLAVDILLVVSQHWARSQTDRADLAGEAG